MQLEHRPDGAHSGGAGGAGAGAGGAGGGVGGAGGGAGGGGEAAAGLGLLLPGCHHEPHLMKREEGELEATTLL